MFSHTKTARDVEGIVQSMGYENSIVFENSLGGIAFHFAIDSPELVDHLISHEAPIFGLLLDASTHHDYSCSLYELSRISNPPPAQEFKKILIGYNDEGVPATTPLEPENRTNFRENEALPISLYTSDLRRIVDNGTSVGMMFGESSRDALYVQMIAEQEKILGCVKMLAPGHHQGFEVETELLALKFTKMIDILERRREGAVVK